MEKTRFATGEKAHSDEPKRKTKKLKKQEDAPNEDAIDLITKGKTFSR